MHNTDKPCCLPHGEKGPNPWLGSSDVREDGTPDWVGPGPTPDWPGFSATFWRQEGYCGCGQHRIRSSLAGRWRRSGDSGTAGVDGANWLNLVSRNAERCRGHAARGRRRRCSVRLSGGEVPPSDDQLHVPHDAQPGGGGRTGAGSVSAGLSFAAELCGERQVHHLAVSHCDQPGGESRARHQARAPGEHGQHRRARHRHRA